MLTVHICIIVNKRDLLGWEYLPALFPGGVVASLFPETTVKLTRGTGLDTDHVTHHRITSVFQNAISHVVTVLLQTASLLMRTRSEIRYLLGNSTSVGELSYLIRLTFFCFLVHYNSVVIVLSNPLFLGQDGLVHRETIRV